MLKKIVLAKIIICLFASIFFGSQVSLKIKSQRAKNREWKPLHVEKIFSLGIEDGLLRPLSVRVDKRGNIYIFDLGDTCVKKFTSDGKFIQKFGKGRGQGPGEFINPTDYGIKNNGEVWICDPVIGYITVFDIKGIPIETYRTNNPPMRLGLFSSNGFLVVPLFFVVPSFFMELSFEKYDARGKLMSIFNLPIPWKKKSRSHLIMDGRLSVDDEDNIYYAFIRVGLLASFSQEGNLRYLVETIDRTPPPEVIKFSGGVRIDPKSPWTALSVNTVDSEIYILSHIGSKNKKGMVLDVYSSFDGRYVYSYEISQKCLYSYVTIDSIFTVEDGSVSKWKRYSD